MAWVGLAACRYADQNSAGHTVQQHNSQKQYTLGYDMEPYLVSHFLDW